MLSLTAAHIVHQPHLQHLEYVDQPFRLHLADGQASSIKCPIGVLGRLRGVRGEQLGLIVRRHTGPADRLLGVESRISCVPLQPG